MALDVLNRSPRLLLGYLSAVNLLLYTDRGLIGSNGVQGYAASDAGPGRGIQGDFAVSNAVDGLLPGAFMVGLLVSAPMFAEASKHRSALRLVCVGLTVWMLACVACGAAPSFLLLVAARMFVGVGEASFVALAAPFIDDRAPAGAKSMWLAVFYLCIPTGYALGYVLGGLLAGSLGWRGPFLVEAALMLPLAAISFASAPIYLAGFKAGAEAGDAAAGEAAGREAAAEGQQQQQQGPVREFLGDCAMLLRQPVYVCLVLGSSVYTGVLGAFSYVGPKSARAIFGIGGKTGDLAFGGVTVATGIAGTLAGGVMLDRLGSGVRNALAICAVCSLAGGGVIALCFLLAPSLPAFLGPFALGELFLFAIQAPQSAVALWAVPMQLRSLALSLMTVCIHVLGDVPSPSALGWLQDRLRNWRLSMVVCTAFLLPAAALYAAGLLCSGRRSAREEEGPAEPLLSDEAAA